MKDKSKFIDSVILPALKVAVSGNEEQEQRLVIALASVYNPERIEKFSPKIIASEILELASKLGYCWEYDLKTSNGRFLSAENTR